MQEDLWPLLHYVELTTNSMNEVLTMLKAKLRVLETSLRSIKHAQSQSQQSSRRRPPSPSLAPLLESGRFALSRLPRFAAPAMIVITDGCSAGDELVFTGDGVVTALRREDVPVGVISVGLLSGPFGGLVHRSIALRRLLVVFSVDICLGRSGVQFRIH